MQERVRLSTRLFGEPPPGAAEPRASTASGVEPTRTDRMRQGRTVFAERTSPSNRSAQLVDNDIDEVNVSGASPACIRITDTTPQEPRPDRSIHEGLARAHEGGVQLAKGPGMGREAKQSAEGVRSRGHRV